MAKGSFTNTASDGRGLTITLGTCLSINCGAIDETAEKDVLRYNRGCEPLLNLSRCVIKKGRMNRINGRYRFSRKLLPKGAHQF
jgi:hypothetical protein